MHELRQTDAEGSVLRWGGLAGMLGSLLFIVVFVVVGAFVGADPGPEGAVMRFPDIRAGRTVENGLYLIVLILWVTHFLALYRALRESRPAAALFGTVLGIVGLTVLAAGALPHAASLPISDLYHAQGASTGDQATLVLVWQATQGIFNALLVTGLVIMPVSLVLLGLAMLGAPAFGKGYGRVSVALGAVGLGAALVLLVDPLSFIAVIIVFALIVFHLALGWKVHRLSQAAVDDPRLTAGTVPAVGPS